MALLATVNALAELPSTEHPGHVVVLEQKRWLLDYLTWLAEKARFSDPGDVAGSLLLLHEGATVAHATGSVDSAATRAKHTAATLLARSA